MTNETAVERLGEALFALSDRLRANNALADNETHDAYEKVVAAFRALSPSPAETDGIREAALEEAARVVDSLIETYRNSDIAECLDDIGSLRFARDKIRALATKDGDTPNEAG